MPANRTARPRAHAPTLVPALFVRVTAQGSGGIAVFVLDGWGLAAKLQGLVLTRKKLRTAAKGEAQFARIVDRAGRMVDEAVVTFLASDETATGYEQVELSCHGGEGAVAAVEACLSAAGFVRAERSELLARAHLNNRLSIVALEAQLALGAAVTERQTEFLLGSTVLSKRWERFGFDAALGMRQGDFTWRERILTAARETVSRAASSLASLQTHSIVIAGPVNAGKSTLANRLVRAERHIVSAQPGTTRDRIESRIDLRGLDVVLSDTAGLRASSDDVELEGQRRAHAALGTAALRLVVLDGSRPAEDEHLEWITRCKALGPTVLVLNKNDLGTDESSEGLGFLAGVDPISVSAETGSGLPFLEEKLEALLLGGIFPQHGDAFTARQVALLSDIAASIENGFEDTLIVRSIMKLISTRGNEEQLKIVMGAGA